LYRIDTTDYLHEISIGRKSINYVVQNVNCKTDAYKGRIELRQANDEWQVDPAIRNYMGTDHTHRNM
jgi:hypothetical protein